MGKFKELRDQLNQVAKKQEKTARTFATKLNQHARRVSTAMNRESKNNEQRIVRLEKRVADLERHLKSKH